MSFQISISGHATGDKPEAQEAAEGKLLEVLRGVVRDFQAAGGEVYSASYNSQYHKSGDLRDAPEVVASSYSEEEEL